MDEGDADALSALDDDLAQRGIVAPAELREAIDEYARTLELRDTCEQFILGQQKDVMETPLLEEFISDFVSPRLHTSSSAGFKGWKRLARCNATNERTAGAFRCGLEHG